MSLLIKMHRFSEELTRFYISELVMVVDSVHNMGFIHRDIKVEMLGLPLCYTPHDYSRIIF